MIKERKSSKFGGADDLDCPYLQFVVIIRGTDFFTDLLIDYAFSVFLAIQI